MEETMATAEVTENYKQMYKEAQVKVEELEATNKQLVDERTDIVTKYNELAKQYERLFKLYANNLDFYLKYTEENK